LPSLGRGRRAKPDAAAAISRAGIERDELIKGWPQFWEELVRDLGREARHPARQSAPPNVVAELDRDLDDRRRADAQARGEAALRTTPANVDEFQRACEELVEKAIEERGFDDDIQAAADLATLLPIALGALGTFLFEKYAHVLGTGIMADARRRWIEVRGRQLAQALTDAALPTTAPHLRAPAARDTALARQLQDLQHQLTKMDHQDTKTPRHQDDRP